MKPEADPKNIVGSILKASRLLDSFSTDRRELTLGEFTRESGYNKTTTYRLLQTLVAAGWLTRTPSGAYRLGMRLLVLGAIARADLDLRNEALSYLQRLADELGDTSFLMVPGPHGAVVIESITGRNPVRIHGITVGSTLPYHVAAGPVALAAYHPDIEAALLAGELARLTANTTVTKTALRDRLVEVRRVGYAVSLEDFMEDVSAVGAPILGADGNAIAALSVGGPANRFAQPARDHTINLVKEFADKLTSRMAAGR